VRRSSFRYWAVFFLFFACDGQDSEERENAHVEVRAQALANDADGDGVADGSDNCPKLSNANQANTNGVGPGDACEVSLVLSSGLLNQYARFQSHKELLLTYAPLTFSLGPDLMKISAKAPSGSYANYFLLSQKLGVTSLSELLTGSVDSISGSEVLSLGLGSDSVLGGGKATDVYLRLDGSAAVSVAFFDGSTARGTQAYTNSGTGVRRFTPSGSVLFDRIELRTTSGKVSIVGPNDAAMFALGQAQLPCASGYERVGGNCVDINECAGLNHVCDALTTCTNTAGSYTCGACPAGYTGTGATTCIDINECATGSTLCSPLVTCNNTAGSYQCGACPAGYRGDGHSCTDINECTENLDDCDALVTCTNRAGGYDCGSCPHGYTGGGSSGCVDVNECTGPDHVCDSLATCTNSPGSYSCGACPNGYRGDGRTCTDIDECSEGSAQCSPLVQCGNTAGSYQCGVCPNGFSGDGRACTDINECADGSAQCAPGVACANAVGSYTCGACPSGYTGDGHTCADINECATSPCDPRALCTNAPGSFSCGACPAGFRGDGFAGCIDIDECAEHRDTCSSLVTCGNTLGSYTCSECPAGYSGDGHTCTDVDECAAHTAQCDAHVACANNVGGYTCGQCPGGFSGDGHTCTDINECATSPCDPLSACTNNAGSYVCAACPAGYQGDGYAGCLDIDECAVNNGGCASSDACVNTQGSRNCLACAAGSVGVVTHCGAGACAATGTTSCAYGAVVDSCAAGQPAASDQTCNNVDDDCNGRVDDGFVSSTSHCGVGACAGSGTVSCVGGTTSDSCHAGSPASATDTCNGIDDDCDGSVDEDFVAQVTHCGAVSCQAAGVTTCIAGVLSDSCIPPSHAATDVTCDGIDDDCDGVADDDYPSVSTDCSALGCATTGVRSCSGGQVVDTCVEPGHCTGEALCDDGLDNDGDHAADCQDSDCFGNSLCLFEVCDDGRDNDADGAADCRDTDCAGGANCPPMPPDPTTVAGPLADSRPSTFSEQVQHLLFGQYNVALTPADFAAEDRVNVLSGYVRDVLGAPMAGVRISVRELPQVGFTFTRDDGRFDLFANAGGLVNVVYEADGYVTVHRSVKGVWEQYAWAPDVVMTKLDSRPVTVGFPTHADTVIRGRAESDDDGTRQATLIIPSGVEAAVTFPDGYSQPLDFGTIRVTELTVGATGPQAMPAPVAANTIYTYALDISVDEVKALGHGEGRVDFSAPIAFYLDNFLDVPVGLGVPAGHYDRNEATWVASQDGRVIQIVALGNDGLASLDIDGDGAAENTEALTAVGIGVGERAKLGELYASGKTLWRIALPHFSVWAGGFIGIPPDPALAPPSICGDWGDTSGADCSPCGDHDGDGLDDCTPYLGDVSNPDTQSRRFGIGSSIQPTNGTLSHSIPLIGTGLSLNYDNGATNRELLQVRIPVTGAMIPGAVERVTSSVLIAGRKTNATYDKSKTLQVMSFEWDGNDAFGRTLQGPQTAEATICYEYRVDGGAMIPSEWCFGRYGFSSGGQTIHARKDGITEVCRVHRRQLRAKALLQPWRLSFDSFLDRSQGVLFQADGGVRSGVIGYNAVASDSTLTTTGESVPFDWDASGPLQFFRDGSLVRVTQGTVKRLRPDGTIQQVGTVEVGNAYALTPQGYLYVLETQSGKIYRYHITYDWQLENRTLVAGGGSAVLGNLPVYGLFSLRKPDQAKKIDFRGVPITRMRGVADGSVVIHNCMPDGTICRLLPDGSLVQQWSNSEVMDIAENGYIAEWVDNRLYREPRPGQYGELLWDTCSEANFPTITHVSTDHNGNVYAAVSWPDGRPQEIRKVRVDPWRPTADCRAIYASAELSRLNGEIATWPLVAKLSSGQQLLTMGLGPSQQLFYLISQHGKTSLVHSRGTATSMAVVSAGLDGASKIFNGATGKVDFFDKYGQYFGSQHPFTGAWTATVQRDGNGRATSYTDAYGNVTNLRSDTDYGLIEVTGPFGQRTSLQHDLKARLTSVVAPAGATWTMTYYPNSSLLQTFTRPAGDTSTHTFDTTGRVSTDQNAAGGLSGLTRSPQQGGGGTGQAVVYTDGDSVPLTLSCARQTDGSVTHTTVDPLGRLSVMTTNEAQTSESSVSPSGTQTVRSSTPDATLGLTRPVVSVSKTLPSGREVTQTEERTSSSGVETATHVQNGRTTTFRFNSTTRTFTLTSPSGRQWTAVVNDVGDPDMVTDAKGVTAYYTRDDRGRVIQVERADSISTFDYGADGLLSASHGPGPNDVTFYTRDALGRVTRASSADGSSTGLTYDNFRLSTITPPGAEPHQLDWTALGELASYTPPGGSAEISGQTPGGRASTTTLPSGRSLQPTYVNGVLTSLTSPAGTTSFDYEVGSGQLRGATTGDGIAIGLGHDGELQASTNIKWPDTPQPVTLSYDYNTAFELSAESLNGALLASYGYDLDGLVTQAGALGIARETQSGSLQTAALQTLSTAYSFDIAGRPSRRRTTRNNAALFDEQIVERDSAGRILSRLESVLGDEHAYEYTYDAQGRLTTVSRDAQTLHTYGYDSNGNRLLVTDWGPLIDPTCNCSNTEGSTWSMTATHSTNYDTQDRIITAQTALRSLSTEGTIVEDISTRTYSYDADGYLDIWTDQATAAVTDLDYDVFGNLRRAVLPSGHVITYEIDARNRRVGRRVDGDLTARWVYRDALRPAAELNAEGDVVTKFIYAEEAHVPSYIVKDGVNYRIVSDDLGSVRLVVEAQTGQVVQRMDFDAFGRVLIDTNPGFQPFGFAGGLYDPMTKLVRFGARDYDAMTGRWTARDPKLFGGGQANLYEYAGGDPINQIDPTGLDSLDLNVNIGAGVGGTFGLSYDLDSWSLSGSFGFGFGIGLGASGGYTATDEKDPSQNALSGPFIQGSVSGGLFGLGGSTSIYGSGGADSDGPGWGGSGTLGFGFGFGASITAGLSFPLYDPAWYQ
jgi:RHS repeat-associated protein